jgi:hypothetical protein
MVPPNCSIVELRSVSTQGRLLVRFSQRLLATLKVPPAVSLLAVNAVCGQALLIVDKTQRVFTGPDVQFHQPKQIPTIRTYRELYPV